jgi:hypothetical protein
VENRVDGREVHRFSGQRVREKRKILQDDKNSVEICLIVVDNDGDEVTWRRKKE